MNRNMFFPLILLSALLLGGCTAAMVGGAAVGGYYVGKDERSVGQITEDGVITSKVNAKYVNDNLVKARDINVDTYNNVVYLYGHVDSRAAYDRAVALARSVKGVKQVVSTKLKIIK
ncbi:MAG: BON domain-containing protein [Granulosicoccaceae bacterium]|jgi:hyperosmotically inducible protein